MWLIKDVQELVLEQRNRVSCWVFKYKCNGSSSEFQGNGRRKNKDQQTITDWWLTLGRASYRAGRLGRTAGHLHKTRLEGLCDLRELGGNRVALATHFLDTGNTSL